MVVGGRVDACVGGAHLSEAASWPFAGSRVGQLVIGRRPPLKTRPRRQAETRRTQAELHEQIGSDTQSHSPPAGLVLQHLRTNGLRRMDPVQRKGNTSLPARLQPSTRGRS